MNEGARSVEKREADSSRSVGTLATYNAGQNKLGQLLK